MASSYIPQRASGLPPTKTTPIRVVTIGVESVGKTSLIHRMRTEKYKPDFTPTIGASFSSYIYGGHQFYLWDTAGSERFTNLLPMYVRGAHFVLICFDLFTSVDRIAKYFTSVREIAPDAIIFLVCTKVDLQDPISMGIEDVFEERKHGSVFASSESNGSARRSMDGGNGTDDDKEPLLKRYIPKPSRKIPMMHQYAFENKIERVIYTSSHTGEGIDHLRDTLVSLTEERNLDGLMDSTENVGSVGPAGKVDLATIPTTEKCCMIQ